LGVGNRTPLSHNRAVEGGSGPLTRGFLFADLRDYTSFVERHGDAAASALLDRYRALVRSAVAQYGGAEVKTEGDSFFVVFPSASNAVRCGLDIVQAAEVATRDDPAVPVRVGVGIHAGETVAGSEGYVGSAVNLAARICAQAQPGEVLVSDTVRGLTRTSLPVTFVDRGRRRLKGIPEAVQLYLVSATAEGATSRGASRSGAQRRYAVPVLAALLLGVGGVSALLLSTTPRAERGSATEPAAARRTSPTGTSRPSVPSPETPRPADEEVLSAGTYQTINFQPPFRFSVGPGWRLLGEEPDDFAMQRLRLPTGYLGAFRPNVLFLGPCSDSPTQRIEGGADGLLTWLEQHPHLETVNPRPRSVNGVTGIQIDLRTSEQAQPCPTDDLHLIALAQPEGNDGTLVIDAHAIGLPPGEQMRLVVLDLPTGTVSFDMSSFGAAEDQYEPFLVEADAVLNTVEFVEGDE
jgi:class 3 adenylate cyclase